MEVTPSPITLQVRPTEALATPPYHCICTKELWVLLVHLLDHRSRTLHTQVCFTTCEGDSDTAGL